MSMLQAIRTVAAGTTAAALTASISAVGTRADEAVRARYLCKGRFDATEVTALFFNTPPSAVVLLEGSEGASRLMQQRSASGARYGDGAQEFWIKGDQATWRRGSAEPLPCLIN